MRFTPYYFLLLLVVAFLSITYGNFSTLSAYAEKTGMAETPIPNDTPGAPDALPQQSSGADQNPSDKTVNKFASLEALLNSIANGVEIWGIRIGAGSFIIGIVLLCTSKVKAGITFMVCGLLAAGIGLVTPGTINWVWVAARDANLFY